MSLSYEQQRLQNIRDNEALLLSLGLSTPPSQSQPKRTTKPATSKPRLKERVVIPRRRALSARRSNAPSEDDYSTDQDEAQDGKDDEDYRSAPRRRTVRRTVPRRSLRASVKESSAPDYTGRTQRLFVEIPQKSKGVKRSRSESDGEQDGYKPMRKAQKLGIRTQNPKTYGHIPGVEVGRWWASRMDCSTDAVHAPTVAGISGSPTDGAYSVALSGGYPDDVDLGYAFTYTGCGGRDLKGTRRNPKNLRTAEQTFDQSFSHSFNASLKRSAQTRLPVRVIRGFKLSSSYAPVTGYRYDGLYVVEKAWMASGLTRGLKVCRYAFKRLEGQAPLPVRVDDPDAGDALARGREQSSQDQRDEVSELAQGEPHNQAMSDLARESESESAPVHSPKVAEKRLVTRARRSLGTAIPRVKVDDLTQGRRRSLRRASMR
ncbi:hypothetical protein IAU60_005608 [Kwoniella sp. DSM 27419]